MPSKSTTKASAKQPLSTKMRFALACFYTYTAMFTILLLAFTIGSADYLVAEGLLRPDFISLDKAIGVITSLAAASLFTLAIYRTHRRHQHAAITGIIAIAFIYIALPYSSGSIDISHGINDIILSIIIDTLTVSAAYILFKEILGKSVSHKK